ncbi:hypothetical protein OXX80_013226, partial [Metschnikowia pulcherrima]
MGSKIGPNGPLGAENSPKPTETEDESYQLYTVTKDGVRQENTESEAQFNDRMYKKTVEFYDLADYQGSGQGDDVVLFLMPLRNAEHVLPMAFHNLMNLTYDHGLIDIAFLVSDCSPGDTTLETVFEYSVALQNGTLADDMLAMEAAKKSANVKGTNELYQLYMDQNYMENVR